MVGNISNIGGGSSGGYYPRRSQSEGAPSALPKKTPKPPKKTEGDDTQTMSPKDEITISPEGQAAADHLQAIADGTHTTAQIILNPATTAYMPAQEILAERQRHEELRRRRLQRGED